MVFWALCLQGDQTAHPPHSQHSLLNMLSPPTQEQTWGLPEVSVLCCCPQWQLSSLPGSVPVPPVHRLSFPAFSHSWPSPPTLWLRANCLQAMQYAISFHGIALHSPDGVSPTDPNVCQSHHWGQVNRGKAKALSHLVPQHKSCFYHSGCLPAGMSTIGMKHKFVIHCKVSQLSGFEGFAFSPMLCRPLDGDGGCCDPSCCLFCSRHIFFLLPKQLREAKMLISGNALYVFCRSWYYLPQPAVCRRDLLVLLWTTTTVFV